MSTTSIDCRKIIKRPPEEMIPCKSVRRPTSLSHYLRTSARLVHPFPLSMNGSYSTVGSSRSSSVCLLCFLPFSKPCLRLNSFGNLGVFACVSCAPVAYGAAPLTGAIRQFEFEGRLFLCILSLFCLFSVPCGLGLRALWHYLSSAREGWRHVELQPR